MQLPGLTAPQREHAYSLFPDAGGQDSEKIEARDQGLGPERVRDVGPRAVVTGASATNRPSANATTRSAAALGEAAQPRRLMEVSFLRTSSMMPPSPSTTRFTPEGPTIDSLPPRFVSR